ncbi:MAG: hypothetical protein ACXW2T_00875, partial [Allosphingosinicella sp.]
MPVPGAVQRRTVPGCALFAPSRFRPRSLWSMVPAAFLLASAPASAIAAETISTASVSSAGMIYVDADLAPARDRGARRPLHARQTSHPIFRQLSDALADYRQSWGGLPQLTIP